MIPTKRSHPGADNEYLNVLVDERYMIHGHTAACKKKGGGGPDGKPCSRGFPAPVQEATHLDEKSGRWVYKRAGGSENVVPYSPYLLQVWGGHCNLLASSGSRAPGYLYGYVHKGAGDRVECRRILGDTSIRDRRRLRQALEGRVCRQA